MPIKVGNLTPLCLAALSLYSVAHSMKIYDITAPIHSAMPVYDGDPGVRIEADRKSVV